MRKEKEIGQFQVSPHAAKTALVCQGMRRVMVSVGFGVASPKFPPAGNKIPLYIYNTDIPCKLLYLRSES